MARPRKNQPVDLTVPMELTVGAIERLICPEDKSQAFLRDSKVPGLRVRVTAAGSKSFVYERKLKDRSTLRRTIGDVRAWSIEQARSEARRLAVIVDTGNDPRELQRLEAEQLTARRVEEITDSVTFAEVWSRYLEERKQYWGDLNYQDHLKMAQLGGEPRKRLPGKVTKPGPLAPLMTLRLVTIDTETIIDWIAKEAVDRPARIRLALRMLNAFLRWAAKDPALKGRLDPTAASGKKVREVAGQAKAKKDYLQREQLKVWFEYVRKIPNPVISAYLQILLLTGARREELGTLQWADVNFRWKGITIKDKVDGEREVPLTPYVESLCQWPFNLTHFWPLILTHRVSPSSSFSASVDSSLLPI